jgi:hypothetical protein
MGKMGETSIGGANYILTIVDEATRFVAAQPIKTKDVASDILMHMINRWERITRQKVVYIRSDRGGEFTVGKLQKEFGERGITPEWTVSYSPESNGMAERANRTIQERVRSMMCDAGTPNELWGECCVYAAHLINLTPSAGIDVTPHEAFYGERPNVSYLRAFGCIAYVHIPKKLRASKLEPKDVQGVFLGVNVRTKTYRVLLEGKVKEARDVICDETKRGWAELFRDVEFDFNSSSNYTLARGEDPSEGPESAGNTDLDYRLPSHTDDDGYQVDDVDGFSSDEDPAFMEDDSSGSQPGGSAHGSTGASAAAPGSTATPPRRYPLRDRRPAERFSPSAGYAALAEPIAEPKSYREAVSGPQAEQWQQAMRDEVDALMANGTYTVTDLPTGAKALPSKWVYKVKYAPDRSIERFKARLVVGGHRQVDGIDYGEVFAPVGRFQSLRTLLAAAASRNQELGAIDISNAFLNAELRIPVYMRMPEGYGAGGGNGNGNTVWRLHKTLYGLKQSPKEWYDLLAASLGDIGLECCPYDQALWRIKPEGDHGGIYMLHWVDDLLIATDSEAAMTGIKTKILSKFKGRDLGNATSYLNMLISRDRPSCTLKLSQPNHIHDFLALINLVECKPRDVPMTVGADFTAMHEGDKPFAEITLYQRAVGALMYISSCTRPDLSYAASCLARHMSKPAERHWQQLKCVGRYLSATKDFGITFGPAAGGLIGFVDSDFAGDRDTRRSRTGYVFMLCSGPISWQSKLQSVVAISTAEAEYVAGAHAAREAVWLRRVACFLGVPTTDALPVNIDNQAALHMATNGSDSARTKHIDVAHHFLREAVAKGAIRMVYIATEDNPADIFTKALAGVKLTKFRGHMGVA